MVSDKRLPELDGIRGIAVLFVVVSHFEAFLFPQVDHQYGVAHPIAHLVDRPLQMGWLGVDIFFVLSGFLITGIILRNSGQPSFYKSFYTRRAARILPAFLVVFLAVVALIAHLQLKVFLIYLFFLANWLILTPFEVFPLQHIWSLAVEEQFYLFWPPLVRRLKKETILRLSLAVVLASILLRIILAAAHVWVYTIYKITPARLDGLAAGAALAVSLQMPKPREFLRLHWVKLSIAASIIFLAGFIWMKGSYFAGNPLSLILGILSVELATCMLIYGSLEARLPDRIRAFLINKPLRWFGRRSYGLYLIHLPLLVAAQHWMHQQGLTGNAIGFAATAITAATSLGLTELSWRLIESPAITYGHRKTHGSDEDSVRTLG